ncbi:peptidylprolyl isomerase [Amycolatopsis benzoatilytica]|uniref:peptidylprolyl isomerase n=1 Tax=Amycolatopsis benzoatilytica TaxID=346045 RepID=UPI000372B19C|nr:peptidyl-prolyl cis-trans isomerase [Amycolatopsis benzoatilytica]
MKIPFPRLKIRPSLVPAHPKAQVFSAALVAVALACSAAQLVVDRITALPDGAVLRVAGKVVSQQEYQQRVHLLSALYGVQAPPDGSKADEFARASAKAVAVSMTLDNAAAQKGIVIADKTASDQLTKIIQEDFPLGRDAFVQKLGQNGVSEPDVLAEVKRQLANQQLYEQVTDRVAAPTDVEVAQAYTARKAQLVRPEARHLRNIVVATEAEAVDAAQQLKSGKDFAQLAGAVSLDGKTKSAGGDLGTLSANQLQQAYAKAAFAAPSGSVFGPVQTENGWNVGQVLGIQPQKQLSLAEAKDQLKTTLLDERRLKVWNDWLGGQMKADKIAYADKYLPANPDTPDAAVRP